MILTILGIRHTKLKSYAKEVGVAVPKFKVQSKNYPSFVTLKTEAFKKLNATSSKGSSNSTSGFCTAILISKLSSDSKTRINEVLGYTFDDSEETTDNPSEELSTASQDFPLISQSQSSDTLRCCDICDFRTRSKHELSTHLQEHPSCPFCKKIFKDTDVLQVHVSTHMTEKCSVCGIFVNKVIYAIKLKIH